VSPPWFRQLGDVYHHAAGFIAGQSSVGWSSSSAAVHRDVRKCVITGSHLCTLEMTSMTDAVEKVGLYDSPPVVPIWAE